MLRSTEATGSDGHGALLELHLSPPPILQPATPASKSTPPLGSSSSGVANNKQITRAKEKGRARGGGQGGGRPGGGGRSKTAVDTREMTISFLSPSQPQNLTQKRRQKHQPLKFATTNILSPPSCSLLFCRLPSLTCLHFPLSLWKELQKAS